ncbi:hypothetical protein F4859DRAFT_519660 [Xylaria cf. heliscus]|nr:hypothetical protein F4859DRAFT_519660 [Xylaria cf. heliscus]
MASTPSPRRPTPSPNEEAEEGLRPKRSNIRIECSDGSIVIFVRPDRPRSGSYAAASHSQPPPSPPPAGPGLGPGPGSGPGASPSPGPGDNRRGKKPRPQSMPAQLNVYDSHGYSDMSQSHRSLPAYLFPRCAECGYHRGHSDACALGHELFLSRLGSPEARPRPLDPMPLRADGDIHDNGIEHQQPQHRHSPHDRGGTRTPQPQPQPVDLDHGRQTPSNARRPRSSVHGETGHRTPRPSRSATPGPPSNHSHARSHSQRSPSHTPSPRQQGTQHGHSPRAYTRTRHTPGLGSGPGPDRHSSSDLSSGARYSIEAVVGRQDTPRSHRRRHRRGEFRFEVRELRADEANPNGSASAHSHSSPNSHSRPPRYFDANIRGGYRTSNLDGSPSSGSHSNGNSTSTGSHSNSNSNSSGSGSRARTQNRSGTGRGRDVILRGLRRCCVAISWLFGGEADRSGRRNEYSYGCRVYEISGSQSRRRRTGRY